MDNISSLIGDWKGTCKTWFEPGVLADESEVSGTISLVFGESIYRHTYSGWMQGSPRVGEDLIAFNNVSGLVESAWIDDFHMNYGILFSQGKQTANGFSVSGIYAVGENEPDWGWRTQYEMVSDNELVITMYNIMPGAPEELAVEVLYSRQ